MINHTVSLTLPTFLYHLAQRFTLASTFISHSKITTFYFSSQHCYFPRYSQVRSAFSTFSHTRVLILPRHYSPFFSLHSSPKLPNNHGAQQWTAVEEDGRTEWSWDRTFSIFWHITCYFQFSIRLHDDRLHSLPITSINYPSNRNSKPSLGKPSKPFPDNA